MFWWTLPLVRDNLIVRRIRMKKLMKTGSRFGFTLMELMVVVVIIGVLASVALPLVGKYMRKSKTAEAGLNLRKIYDGELAYYTEEHTDSAGILASKMFAGFPFTPSGPPGLSKKTANWDAIGWGAIRFNPDGPVQYAYAVASSPESGRSASFTARAVGDLDQDNTTSLFERVGSVNSVTGEVEGGAAIYMLDELE